MKRSLKILIGVVASVCLIFAILLGGFFICNSSKLTADFSKLSSKTANEVAGYLSGTYEKETPSSNVVESVSKSTVIVKPSNGIDTLVSDVDSVAKTNVNQIIVYVQDKSDTDIGINEYTEKLNKVVNQISSQSYFEKIVYSILNNYDDTDFSKKDNREEFYSSWKKSYKLIKSIDYKAKISCSSFPEFNKKYFKEFLEFANKNNCLPDLMLWNNSSDNNSNVEEYRKIEKELKIKAIPISIIEYSQVGHNSNPGEMIKYISTIENTKFQKNTNLLLANDLQYISANENSPNSSWWLFKWYSQMSGKAAQLIDNDLNGVVYFDEDNFKIEIICGGQDNKGAIQLENLDMSSFKSFNDVRIRIESINYNGSSTVVSNPIQISQYEAKVKKGMLKIKLKDISETSVYHIVIEPKGIEKIDNYKNKNLPVRYEAENAKLVGDANPVESKYAFSGKSLISVENNGEIQFKVKCKENGSYRFDVIYGGNSEETQQKLYIDGNEEDTIIYPIVESGSVSFNLELEKGSHTITLKADKGDVKVDFIDVTFLCGQYDELPENVYNAMADQKRTTSTNKAFLISVPEDGNYDTTFYFTVNYGETVDYIVNGEPTGKIELSTRGMEKAKISLKQGLNYIEVPHNKENSIDEIFAVKITEDNK